MSDTIKLKTFLDAIGRVILGEFSSETEETLTIKNPVILHVVPDNQGRMSVQLLPLFFREFLASKDDDVKFSYKKENITETDIESFDFRLSAQYSQLFNKSNIFVPPAGSSVTSGDSKKVVNLFDE